MDQLLAQLPAKPVLITGELVTADPKASQKTRLHVSILFSFGPHRDMARYTIRDAFGGELEQVTVTRKKDAAPQVEYAQGNPLVTAPAPSLLSPIQDTAASWLDLTLSFLWWRTGAIIGKQEVKEQPCYVLDVNAPSGASGNYGHVRLWIDVRVSMLLQAEAYDDRGTLVRRIAIKSFKKIDEQWMIKDLEIQDFAAARRTILRVQDVQPVPVETPARSE